MMYRKSKLLRRVKQRSIARKDPALVEVERLSSLVDNWQSMSPEERRAWGRSFPMMVTVERKRTGDRSDGLEHP